MLLFFSIVVAPRTFGIVVYGLFTTYVGGGFFCVSDFLISFGFTVEELFDD